MLFVIAGAAQQVEHFVARFAVEVAGRLVGEGDGGFGDQGAGNGDALLLPTGKLVGTVLGAVVQADQRQQPADALGVILDAFAVNQQRQRLVLRRAERGQQIEELKVVYPRLL